MTNLWRRKTLRVRFLDAGGVDTGRVLQIASQWVAHSGIRFVVSNDVDAEIRVSFDPGGSWSMVGTDSELCETTSPTMNFGWLSKTLPEKEWQAVVLHEFGHALGCIHEHQSPGAGVKWNRARVHEVYSQMGWDADRIEHNVLVPYTAGEVTNSAFDPSSIMLYPIDASLTLDGYSTQWNWQLSPLDKAFMRTRYLSLR